MDQVFGLIHVSFKFLLNHKFLFSPFDIYVLKKSDLLYSRVFHRLEYADCIECHSELIDLKHIWCALIHCSHHSY